MSSARLRLRLAQGIRRTAAIQTARSGERQCHPLPRRSLRLWPARDRLQPDPPGQPAPGAAFSAGVARDGGGMNSRLARGVARGVANSTKPVTYQRCCSLKALALATCSKLSAVCYLSNWRQKLVVNFCSNPIRMQLMALKPEVYTIAQRHGVYNLRLCCLRGDRTRIGSQRTGSPGQPGGRRVPAGIDQPAPMPGRPAALPSGCKRS
jgi:hypothetical protein